MPVEISKGLQPENRLWRYMSLDKLIDLLSTRSLYMSPVTQFEATDPYEGQDHPQTVKIWADMMRRSYEDNLAILRQLESAAIQEHCDQETFSKYKALVTDLPHSIERMKLKQERSVRMSCWHGNEGESEAMWKLYGDTGKSVAVMTTVGALAESVSVEGIGEVVDIIPVKYLNFAREYDPTELKDFRGRITVTKRLAYQHEQEVRLTIRPVPQSPKDWEQTDFAQPIPIRLSVDVSKLIQEIHISPYPAAPFESSVRAVCQMFGVNGECIRTSSLLRYKRASISDFLALPG